MRVLGIWWLHVDSVTCTQRTNFNTNFHLLYASKRISYYFISVLSFVFSFLFYFLEQLQLSFDGLVFLVWFWMLNKLYVIQYLHPSFDICSGKSSFMMSEPLSSDHLWTSYFLILSLIGVLKPYFLTYWRLIYFDILYSFDTL